MLFDAEGINPGSYDKSAVVEAKHKHSQFSSLADEEWFAAFRRAASDYILEEDHNEVGRGHNNLDLQAPTPKVSVY